MEVSEAATQTKRPACAGRFVFQALIRIRDQFVHAVQVAQVARCASRSRRRGRRSAGRSDPWPGWTSARARARRRGSPAASARGSRGTGRPASGRSRRSAHCLRRHGNPRRTGRLRRPWCWRAFRRLRRGPRAGRRRTSFGFVRRFGAACFGGGGFFRLAAARPGQRQRRAGRWRGACFVMVRARSLQGRKVGGDVGDVLVREALRLGLHRRVLARALLVFGQRVEQVCADWPPIFGTW